MALKTQPPKFKMLVQTGTHDIDLGDGNWIRITQSQTSGNRRDYLRELSGGLMDAEEARSGRMKVDPGVMAIAAVRSRLVDWHIVQDGEEIPFDKATLDLFPPEVVNYLVDEIAGWDRNFTANETGLDNPNA